MPPDTLTATRPRIQLAGVPRPDLDSLLQQLIITHAVNDIARCRAEFSVPPRGDAPASESDLAFAFGAELTIEAGDEAAAPLFNGRIVGIGAQHEHDHPPRTVVVADDSLRALHLSQRTFVFANMNARDAIEAIAARNGLFAEIAMSSSAIQHEVMFQANQTDLEFLRALALSLDVAFWCEDDCIVVQRRDAWHQGPSLSFGSTLHRFDVLADLTTQATALHVSGWDPQAKQPIAAQAGPGTATTALNNGKSGSATLNETFGGQAQRVVHLLPADDPHAESRARARFEAQARRFITGTGTAVGVQDLSVGQIVTLDGLTGGFDGSYYVVAVRHHFDQLQGYRAEFDVERSDMGARSRRKRPRRPKPDKPTMEKR